MSDVEDPLFICDNCSKAFKNRRYLNQHLKRVHQIHKAAKLSLNCAVDSCQFFCRTLAQLRKHTESRHKCKIECIKMCFTTYEDFMKWKHEEELKEKISYSMRSSGAVGKGEKKIYFLCNRSGFYNRTSKGLRATKAQGTCKLDGYCPSSIEAVISDVVNVKYFRTHLGHEKHLAHLKMRKPVREKITAQDDALTWRTVRANYVRVLRNQKLISAKRVKKAKSYIYGKQLSFPKKGLKPGPTSGSTDSHSTQTTIERKEDICINEERQDPTTEETIASPQPSSPHKTKTPDSENTTNSLIPVMDNFQTRTSSQLDEDDAFFCSILPMVKALTPDDKLTFRIETMKLLQNLQRDRSYLTPMPLVIYTPPWPSPSNSPAVSCLWSAPN